MRPFLPLRPGRQRKAAEENRLQDLVYQHEQAGATGPYTRGAGGVQFDTDRPVEFWARITEAVQVTSSGAFAYGWSKLSEDPENAVSLQDDPEGISSTADAIPAYEVLGRTVPIGSVVWLRLSESFQCFRFEWDGEDDDNDLPWRRQCCEPWKQCTCRS